MLHVLDTRHITHTGLVSHSWAKARKRLSNQHSLNVPHTHDKFHLSYAFLFYTTWDFLIMGRSFRGHANMAAT